MQWLIRDLRFTCREIVWRPGFSLLAILTLALGIGAVTTMYSVIQNVLLNPFPYTDPVVSEVALSLVLLAGAGVLMRSFLSMVGLDLGFNPHNLVLASISFSDSTPSRHREFFERALPRIAAMPGIVSASETTGFPPYGAMETEIDVPGKVHHEQWTGLLQRCSSSYFPTLGLRFLRGSPFSQSDVANARTLAVVNQTFVRKYLQNNDPIGRHIRLARLASAPDSLPDPSFEIVGVVADIRNARQRAEFPRRSRSKRNFFYFFRIWLTATSPFWPSTIRWSSSLK